MTQLSHAHLSAKNTTNVTENIRKNVSSLVFPPACQLGPGFGRLATNFHWPAQHCSYPQTQSVPRISRLHLRLHPRQPPRQSQRKRNCEIEPPRAVHIVRSSLGQTVPSRARARRPCSRLMRKSVRVAVGGCVPCERSLCPVLFEAGGMEDWMGHAVDHVRSRCGHYDYRLVV